jgi:hypothetical protein
MNRVFQGIAEGKQVSATKPEREVTFSVSRKGSSSGIHCGLIVETDHDL